MNEIKCPECGHVFQVSQEVFDSLAAQVRNAVFDKEIARRSEEIRSQLMAELKADRLKAEKTLSDEMSKSAAQLQQATAEIEVLKERLRAADEKSDLRLERERAEIAKKHDAELRALEVRNQDLASRLQQSDGEKRLALMEQKAVADRSMMEKEQEILRLRNDVAAEQQKSALREANLKEQHALEVRRKDETIEFYKDLKARMSTKMIGESLEVHCANEFNRVRNMAYPNAYFEKDNEVADGTKGDFIFRDFIDGQEYISIMFEMKNEADTTATKHRNEDFLAKLHNDRTKKGCEYAVLVSLLEPDNELYNEGIVNMSHRYPNMYVIRPQFFMPIIALLSQASRKSADYKREIELARRKEIDVTNFENKLNDFRDRFGRNYRLASEKFSKAIEEIDKTIKHLQNIKDALIGSENNLRLANKNAEDLTIRRLTHGNPTMKEKFREAAARAEEQIETDDE